MFSECLKHGCTHVFKELLFLLKFNFLYVF
jgi:hypothetical protein